MGSITFGLIAALSWGIHDILVRYVGQTIGILRSLFLVLLSGAIIQSVVSLAFADFGRISSTGLLYSCASGMFFALACIGHYNAFSKGPVKLVAPLIGTYSVVAFFIAALLGAPITALQWVAVVLLAVGIGLVARSDNEESSEEIETPLSHILLYCVLAIIGFSLTFTFGHKASAVDDIFVSGLITRFVSIAIIGVLFALHLKRHAKAFVWPAHKDLLIIVAMGALDALALGVVLAAGVLDRPEFAAAVSACFGLITVILAWMFLKERINAVQWGGIISVFAAIAYLSAS